MFDLFQTIVAISYTLVSAIIITYLYIYLACQHTTFTAYKNSRDYSTPGPCMELDFYPSPACDCHNLVLLTSYTSFYNVKIPQIMT